MELLLFNLAKGLVEESQQAEMVFDYTENLSSVFINPLWLSMMILPMVLSRISQVRSIRRDTRLFPNLLFFAYII